MFTALCRAASHRRVSPSWLCVGFLGLLFTSVTTPAAADSTFSPINLLKGTVDYTIRDCRTQVENEQYEVCRKALLGVQAQLVGSEVAEIKELNELVSLRLKLLDAHRRSRGLMQEHPDQSVRILFSAYTALPEKFFPYEEVAPLWNLYLRDESGRSRFARYRNMKLLVKSPKDAPDLEDLFSRGIQPKLLEYGFVYTDPSGGKPPDVLIKVAVKLLAPDAISDPKSQFSRSQRISLEFQSFKWILSEQSVKQEPLELEASANSDEEMRTLVVTRGAERTADLLFYHTLKMLFPPETSREGSSGSGSGSGLGGSGSGSSGSSGSSGGSFK